MAGCTWLDRVCVKFHGDRGGEGPLTLGQRNTYQWVSNDPGSFFAVIQWVFEVPRGCTLDDVAEAWQVLMGRHESLRTTFPPGPDGWPAQRVMLAGELPIEVYRADGDGAEPAALARELINRVRLRPFDVGRELPVRAAVAAGPGGVLAAVGVYSHMAVDFASMAVLGRQFTELVAGHGREEPEPRVHQPLDQAASERTPRRRAQAETAVRYWLDQLRNQPQCLFAMPRTPAPAEDAGQPLTCWLRSPAAAQALTAITRRTGASAPMAVLAAVSAVLAHRTGIPQFKLASLSSNRFGGRLRDYVGTIAQDSLIAIDTTGGSFDELVRRAGTGTLRAHRCSMFDSVELAELAQAVNRSRGTSYDRDSVFNNLSSHHLSPGMWDLAPRTPDTGTLAPPPGPAGRLAARLAESTLEWGRLPELVPVLLLFELLAWDGALELKLTTGDTERVPRPEFRLLLRGVERLLVAAAGCDADLGELTRLTGVEPVCRGGGWLHIDSCWVELAAVQRLLDDALPDVTARVFAVPGPDGQPVLTAYLAVGGSPLTAQNAHTACMRVLPGRPTAMAPARYVLCGSTPRDPAGLAGWRRQSVLASGDGR